MNAQDRLTKKHRLSVRKKVKISKPHKRAKGARVLFALFLNQPKDTLAFRMYLVFPGGDYLVLFEKISLAVKPALRDTELLGIPEICERLSGGDSSDMTDLVTFIKETIITHLEVTPSETSTKFHLELNEVFDPPRRTTSKGNNHILGFVN